MMCDACEQRVRELVEAVSGTSARVEVSWTCPACGQVRFTKNHSLDVGGAQPGSGWPPVLLGMVAIAAIVAGLVITKIFGATP